jgi:hypothetical protein
MMVLDWKELEGRGFSFGRCFRTKEVFSAGERKHGRRQAQARWREVAEAAERARALVTSMEEILEEGGGALVPVDSVFDLLGPREGDDGDLIGLKWCVRGGEDGACVRCVLGDWCLVDLGIV